MKKILTIIILTTILSCQPKNKTAEVNTETETTSKTTIVSDFLTDISSLEKIEGENPIVLFQSAAENKADKVMTISKENIEEVLTTAKDYNNLVIITGDHTLVKVTDVENCKPSGSWAACMPFGSGYIKKGALSFKEDYINNIIGLPDSQVRKAYFFEAIQ